MHTSLFHTRHMHFVQLNVRKWHCFLEMCDDLASDFEMEKKLFQCKQCAPTAAINKKEHEPISKYAHVSTSKATIVAPHIMQKITLQSLKWSKRAILNINI